MAITVSELWIYPIKSLGGVSLSSVKVFQKGFENDRRWMLVDEDGVFMTQRTIHTLSLFRSTIHDQQIKVQFQNQAIEFKMGLMDGLYTKVKVWESEINGLEVSPEVSEWFTDMLKKKCKLIFFPEVQSRKVEDPYPYQLSLADAFPLLTIGQSSLNDLNSRIVNEQAVPMNRFRPNLVVCNSVAYEEDTWKNFRIGSASFLGARKSYRCIVTTIDQVTGMKGREPLLTLSKYRKEDTKIFFGLNTLVTKEGNISVGDQVTFE